MYANIEIVFSKYMKPDNWYGVYTKQRTAAVSNDHRFCWMFVRRKHTLEGVQKLSQ
jgi:hypothetical protein